jgi:hypothetical protein
VGGGERRAAGRRVMMASSTTKWRKGSRGQAVREPREVVVFLRLAGRHTEGHAHVRDSVEEGTVVRYEGCARDM